MTPRVKPIPFIKPMVKALLREVEVPGTGKTNTRRVLVPQPPEHVTGSGRFGSTNAEGFWKDQWSWLSGDQTDLDAVEFEGDFKTGYLEGDLLWVREAWRAELAFDWTPPRDIPAGKPIYHATSPAEASPDCAGKFRRGRFMCRWMSRLTLRVTDVRVERLTDISAEDVRAEGTEVWERETRGGCMHPIRSFGYLWDSINGKRPGCAWADNPWVAAIRFEVVKANVDTLRDPCP